MTQTIDGQEGNTQNTSSSSRELTDDELEEVIGGASPERWLVWYREYIRKSKNKENGTEQQD